MNLLIVTNILLITVLVCSMKYGDGEVIVRCLTRERKALLKFKEGLVDKHGMTSSWGKENECCKWEGVECSNTTGHVIALRLVGQHWSLDHHYLGGEVNSALLELHNLKVLDLSQNYFTSNKIPEVICSMSNLQHLFLSYSNFSGNLPPRLWNLTNLKTLDLSFNYFSGIIPPQTGRLTNLVTLDLSINQFSGTLPLEIGNLTNLEALNLIQNQFFGTIPPQIENLINLEAFHLTQNQFFGMIPPQIGNLTNLNALHLSYNRFSGTLPPQLWQLLKLEELRISNNSLEGTITEAGLGKLTNLKIMDLSSNSLALDISPDWTPPFQLTDIGLSGCKLGPHFPLWLHTSTNFTWLDLSRNGILGEIPTWLSSLSHQVFYLDLSHNQLSGTLTDFSSMVISAIDVSSNNFSGPIPLFSPNTWSFLMPHNTFSGSFSFNCSIPYDLQFLDLSDNHLSGKLPNCWGNMTELIILSLANNQISGEIPHSLGSLSKLYIFHFANNNFSGELPSTLKNCKLLHFLNIGDNRLSGSIPTWIGGYHQTIAYLIIRNNRFYGSIPPQICYLSHIQVLDLSGNNISGHLPPCFHNFTYFVENNISIQNTGYGGEEITKNTIVSWKRKEIIYGRNLVLLKLVDLSSNRLDGNIPKSFSSLKALISLNLSRNRLTGIIDPDIGQMNSLDSLDLSSNHLSGVIPVSMTKLYSLGVLDLAKNNLSGEIPIGSQLQTFPPSAYEGNIGLCGNPLPPCSEDRPNPSTNNKAQNVDDDDDSIMSLSFLKEIGIPTILGFIVGFWGVVGSLIVKESWRRAFYNFWGAVGDWFYVRANIFWAKLRRS